ncbi:THO complex subunit 2 [Bonamia ostreae]|uniref:THO complex subunit 2 n=1 Tax=Bonamia ostreae TaxID=126728 RepID=A0ABV2AKM3_9EUKA
MFSLYESNAIQPLLIKIAANIKAIFWNCTLELGINGVQTLSFQHSISCRTFFSLAEFLALNLGNEEYATYVPPINVMFKDLKLRPQEIFSLSRRISLNVETKVDIESTEKAVSEYLAENFKDCGVSTKFYMLFWMGELSYLMTEKAENLYKDTIEMFSKINSDRETKKTAASVAAKLKKELKNRILLKNNFLTKCELMNEPSKCFDVENANRVFLEICVLPRCVYSPHDAVYSANFIFLAMSKNLAGLSFVNFTQNLYQMLPSLIQSATEDEASNFGRFLRQFLSTSSEFCTDKIRFEKLATDNPCFMRGNKSYYDSEEFRLMFYRIHDKFFFTFAKILSNNTRKDLLRNANTAITNTAQILKQINSVFPLFRPHLEEIKQLTQKVIGVVENQSNLKTILVSLLGLLERNKNTVLPERFSRKYVRLNQSKQRMENLKRQLLQKKETKENETRKSQISSQSNNKNEEREKVASSNVRNEMSGSQKRQNKTIEKGRKESAKKVPIFETVKGFDLKKSQKRERDKSVERFYSKPQREKRRRRTKVIENKK